MELHNIHIPEELIINILQFLEFQDIKNFYQVSRESKNIIFKNFNYIFIHSDNRLLRNFYIIFGKKINTRLNVIEKLGLLIKNYIYEKRRYYVICQKSEENLYTYEKSIAPLGFFKFKNFTKLISHGFDENSAYFASKYIPDEKIHLLYYLYNEGLRHIDIVDIVSTKDTNSVYCLVNLIRKRFSQKLAIKSIMTLNQDQIDNLFLLSNSEFPKEYCYDIVCNFDKRQINKMLMLKNMNFNYLNCVRCATQLCDEKFHLLIKLKKKISNPTNLTKLVFKSHIIELRNMISKL